MLKDFIFSALKCIALEIIMVINFRFNNSQQLIGWLFNETNCQKTYDTLTVIDAK